MSFDTFNIQQYQDLGLQISNTGENGCLLTVPNGCLGNNTGNSFEVYVPYNIDDNTNTALAMFAPKSIYAEKGPVTSKNALLNSGSESLVVFVPGDIATDNPLNGNTTANCMEALDLAHELFGGNNQNVSVHSGSNGGLQACCIAAENYEQNIGTYDSKITNIALFSSSNTDKLLNENLNYKLDILAKNNVSVFDYTSGYKNGNAGREVTFAEEYANRGGSVIIADTSIGGHDDKCLADYKDNYFDFIRGNSDLAHPEQVTFHKLEYVEEVDEFGNSKTVLKSTLLDYETMKKTAQNDNYIIVDKDGAIIDTPVENVDYSDLTNQYAYLKDLTFKPEDYNLTSDESFIIEHVEKITNLIKTSAFLQGIQNNSYSSTTNIPLLEDIYIKEFYSQTGQLLDIISKEINNAIKIYQTIKQTDEKLTNAVEEIPIIEDTNVKATNTIPVLTTPIIEKTFNTPNSTTPNNSTETEEINTTISNNVNNNSSSNSSYTNVTNNNYQSNYIPNTNTTNNPPTSNNSEIENYFPNYDELYSDANKTVYDCKDFKLIIHNDGEKITGFEYYYNLGSEENALNSLNAIKEKYQSVDMVDKILQKDRYIKITFKEDLFKDYTLSTIKTKFSSFQEITS